MDLECLFGSFWKRIVLTLIFTVSCTLLFPKTICFAERSYDDVVAIVFGKEIKYADIVVLDDKVREEYGGKIGDKELKAAVLERETRWLRGRICNEIAMREIEKARIAVTDEEALARLTSDIAKAKVDDNFVKKIAQDGSIILQALEEWLANPQDEETIYRARVSQILSKDEWEAYKKRYSNWEVLEELRAMIPSSIEDMKRKSLLSMKMQIAFEKLKQLVTKHISISERELHNYYVAKYKQEPRPVYQAVKSQLKEELLQVRKREAMASWWQKRYKEAKIEIKDERFKHVIEMFIFTDKEIKK